MPARILNHEGHEGKQEKMKAAQPRTTRTRGEIIRRLPGFHRFAMRKSAKIGKTCPCERSAAICGLSFLNRRGQRTGWQLATANRLLTTGYRLPVYLLACASSVCHNTPQTSNLDEAAMNALEPFVGYIDVVRAIASGMHARVREPTAK